MDWHLEGSSADSVVHVPVIISAVSLSNGQLQKLDGSSDDPQSQDQRGGQKDSPSKTVKKREAVKSERPPRVSQNFRDKSSLVKHIRSHVDMWLLDPIKTKGGHTSAAAVGNL